MGLRILITNRALCERTGTELYVRDLAVELARQGHEPLAYAWLLGPIAREMRQLGVRVTGSLLAVGAFRPDVIHGHHTRQTLDALRRFPRVPAIFVCHDHTAWTDVAPRDPRVRGTFGVSRLCVERLVRDGVARDRATLLPNFVDTRRFRARPPLPARPRRALVFSNYAAAHTHLPAVSEACRRLGLPLDVAGAGVGRPLPRPEEVLPDYDLVFAKGKAALEALAVGAAVVLCDFGGVGPLVTCDAFDELRAQNFGFEALREPLAPEALVRQIARYDPGDAARARDRVRAEAGLDGAAARLVDIYEKVIAVPGAPAPPDLLRPVRVAADATVARLSDLWSSLGPEGRGVVTRLPGMRSLRAAARRLVR